MSNKPPLENDTDRFLTLEDVTILDLDPPDLDPPVLPPADTEFPEEVTTSPELRVQITKNITTSREVVSHAHAVLEKLRNSTYPPKE